MNKHVEKVKMFKLPYFNTENSSVGHVEIEGGKDIPFDIKRNFYTFGAGNKGMVRGKHANKKSKFVLFNIAGTSKVKVIDEKMNSRVYELNHPYDAVYLPELVWKEMYDFSEDSILMVLTNEYYDNSEYIRDFDDYVKIIEKDFKEEVIE